jgi:hypothetical protein
MAIFPIHNKHTVNYSVNVSDSFISGMALAIDLNGNAVKADRNNISLNSVIEGFSKFIGFASGDHANTSSILLSDPVGSNYIDSNNRFIDNVNSHYSASKRSIQDFKDESVSGVLFSEYSKRGIGVYNLQGEIFITDQFARVEGSLLNIDGIDQINFIPGDLLTFGAGINAGKLVKVDISGSGPSVLIIGIVEKFEEASNLLYFKHVLETYNNTVSLFTTGITLNLDANNPTSNPGSGEIWYDLSGNGLNANLLNGAVFNSDYIDLDGSNDFISIPSNTLFNFPGDFTVETLYYAKSQTLHSMMARRNMGGGGVGAWSLISFFRNDYQWGSAGSGFDGGIGFGFSTPTEFNKWFLFSATRSGSTLTLYLNGLRVGSFTTAYNHSSIFDLTIGKWDNGTYNPARVGAARLYQNVALTPSQIRQNYNATMGRFI